VRAYLELIANGAPGEIYNVCSGSERSIRSLLDRLIAISGLRVEIRQDPSRMRAAEQLRSFGNFDKLGALTGWRPRYAIDQTLHDMLDEWKERLTHE
jgi:GDP-4-dehydro-6-deoxy-D-mannose reductase